VRDLRGPRQRARQVGQAHQSLKLARTRPGSDQRHVRQALVQGERVRHQPALAEVLAVI
jgi:hypothetical protein